MKVIRSGRRREKPIQRQCECGCIFEWTSQDLKTADITGDSYLKCPECGEEHVIVPGGPS